MCSAVVTSYVLWRLVKRRRCKKRERPLTSTEDSLLESAIHQDHSNAHYLNHEETGFTVQQPPVQYPVCYTQNTHTHVIFNNYRGCFVSHVSQTTQVLMQTCSKIQSQSYTMFLTLLLTMKSPIGSRRVLKMNLKHNLTRLEYWVLLQRVSSRFSCLYIL